MSQTEVQLIKDSVIVNADISGSAAIAASKISGTVSAATTSTNVTVADESTDTTCFLLFATAATGDLPPKSGSNLTFNSNTGVLTATSFAGDGSNLTGVTSVGGANGVDFNDDVKARFGTGNDLEIFHDASDSIISDGGTGNLLIKTNGPKVGITTGGGTEIANFVNNGKCELFHSGTSRFETTSTGISVTGHVGINTASPSAKLQVSGGHINIDSGYSYQWGDSHERIEQSDGKIEFFTNNGQQMTLSGSNLGIGSDAPASRLDILNTGANADISLRSTTNSFNSFIFDSARIKDTQFAIIDGRWNGNSVARIQFVTGSDDTNYDDGYMAFHTRYSGQSLLERLKITSGGSVRIDGSTSSLHGLRFTPNGWNSYDNRMGYCGTSGADFWWSSNWSPATTNRDHSGYATNYIRQNIQTGYLSFGTGGIDESADERLRITNGGSVGIGSIIYHLGDDDTEFGFPSDNAYRLRVGNATRIYTHTSEPIWHRRDVSAGVSTQTMLLNYNNATGSGCALAFAPSTNYTTR